MSELTEFQKQDRADASRGDLCTPDTLRIQPVLKWWHEVWGGPNQLNWVATFASPIAAEHFVHYCVENEKIFGGMLT